MKKTVSIIFIMVFSLMNVFSFVGCRSTQAAGEEVRACWVTSVGNLDFPSGQGLSAAALKTEIDTIVKNCKSTGINAIFFQVRPNGDALYASSIFPWSVYLSGKQGVAPDGNFDPLAYFVRAAHGAGIQLQAWINPYRIGSGSDVWQNLSANNPAVLHPEYTITSNSGVYYNPGMPEARKLILDGIAELVKNYEIDGIHFDDYFYPYDLSGFDDSIAYAQYGGGLSLADFRRNAVNQLVKEAYTLIKTIRKSAAFGISPFGIWANQSVMAEGSATSGMSSYATIYSDSKTWVEQGWLDYVCPQIYWSFDNKAAPYGVLVDWWDALCAKNNVKLYVGLALYKVGTAEVGFEQADIMTREIQYAAKKTSYGGHCFFRYGLMMQNKEGVLDAIVQYYGTVSASGSKASFSAVVGKSGAIVGAGNGSASSPSTASAVKLPEATALTVTSPADGVTVEAGGISVAGTVTPGKKVTVNGVNAIVSEKGLFAAYIPLTVGKNKITVQAGGSSRVLWINRSGTAAESSGFAADSFYPSGMIRHSAGQTVLFQVEAPSGASVILTNGTVSIPLEENTAGVYQSDWIVPVLPVMDKLTLDGFSLSGIKDGQTFTSAVDLTLELQAEPITEEWYLANDAYLFDQSYGGSQMDNDPLPKGTPVRSVAEEGDRLLLENGFWVNRDSLTSEATPSAEEAGYDYEILQLSASADFGFFGSSSDTYVALSFTGGGRTQFEAETMGADLSLSSFRSAQGGNLILTSGSGKKIAGYELMAQQGRVTVYVRFQTGELAGKHIVLDAGHGGSDTGALGAGGSAWPTESQLNLVLAEALKQELENAGAQVTMLRTEDTSISLEDRVKTAESLLPDFFISLHHNATVQTADFTQASGGLVLYSSPLSKSLADHLAGCLWDGISDFGQVPSRRQSLYVCRETQYPAVLVEAGYLCNPVEYEMLCKADIAQSLAKNIVKGIENWLNTESS